MSGEREEEVFLLPSRDLKGVNNSPWAPKSLGKYPEGKPAWASGRGLAIAAVDMTAMRILDICMIEMVWRHEDSVEKSEIWYLYVCISQWILLYCRMANIRTVCIAFTWSPILFHISSCPGTFWKLKRGLKSFAKMLCVGRKVNQINLVLKSILCLIEDLLSIPSTARKWYPLDWGRIRSTDWPDLFFDCPPCPVKKHQYFCASINFFAVQPLAATPPPFWRGPFPTGWATWGNMGRARLRDELSSKQV